MTTIARGLVTIKRFRAGFNETLRGMIFSGVFRNGTEISTAKKITEFCDESRKNIQSIRDKLDADFELRCKINKANYTNVIEIGGRTMTINDALTYRQHTLPQLKVLHARLVKDLQSARSMFTQLERDFDIKLANTKADDIELKNLLEKREKPSILDIQTQIDELKAQIDFFDLEFDALLTERNPLIVIG